MKWRKSGENRYSNTKKNIKEIKMFEWRCLPKKEKDSIIREYMRQDEEKDFKEYARKKYNIFFTENDIELYLYEFEEKPQEVEEDEKGYTYIDEKGNKVWEKKVVNAKEEPQEETKVKEKVKRKKLSEMTDIELKEYYRQKEEEKRRRIRVQQELKAEEEHRKAETRRRLEAEYYEEHREEIEAKKRAEAERMKEYDRKCAKETIIGIIAMIAVLLGFVALGGGNIKEAFIVYMIMFGWIIIPFAIYLIKGE